MIFIIKLSYYTQRFMRRNKRKIRLILATLSTMLLVLFTIYFSLIEFNYQLIGYFPVNKDAPEPTNSDGSINEDYPWEFKLEIYYDKFTSKTLNISNDIDALINLDRDETIFIYLDTADDGIFSWKSVEELDTSEFEIFWEVDQAATRRINSYELNASLYNGYFVTYVLHQKYNCWVPCYVDMARENNLSFHSSTDNYFNGISSHGGTIKQHKEILLSDNFPYFTSSEEYIKAASTGFPDDFNGPNEYRMEMAMKAFAKYEGKNVILDEISSDFKYRTFVSYDGKETDLSTSIRTQFPYFRNKDG